MQPPNGRRVALSSGLVGQIAADMFMQVFIERAPNLLHPSLSRPLILVGVLIF